MEAFVALAKEKTMARLASTLCATGGGAFKFQVSTTVVTLRFRSYIFTAIPNSVGDRRSCPTQVAQV